MLQRLFSAFLLLLCLFAVNFAAAQTVPRQMSYQGKLNDAAGIPFSGTIDIKFVITATSNTNVQQQWTETQTLNVVNGLYSTTLGTFTPIPLNIFTKKNPSLSIFIDGTELLPRISLVSVPYSFFAEHVGTLDDDMVESNHIVNGTIKLEDIESDISDANTLLYITPAGNLRWRDADDFVTTVQAAVLRESTTASNALNLVGKDVRLGGALTQNTAIDLNGFALGISVTTGSGFIAFNNNGDFTLPIGTNVNNIVTLIDNADYNALTTEGAVFDFINASLGSSAGSGLTNSGVNIDLGGNLTIPTTITTTATNDLNIGGPGDLNIFTQETTISSNDKVGISTAGGLNMDANFLSVITNTTATINAATGIELISNNNSSFKLTTGDLTLESGSGDVFISAVNTQITNGTFALPTGAVVNNIVTIINISSTHSQLPTAKAVNDAITAAANPVVATNGLNTPAINQVELGGNLTQTTTIDGQTNDFAIQNVDNLNLLSNIQTNITSPSISLTAAAASNFTTSAGDLTLEAAGGKADIRGIDVSLTASTGNVDIRATDVSGKDVTIAASNIISVDAINLATIFGGAGVNINSEGNINTNSTSGDINLIANAGQINIGNAASDNIDLNGVVQVEAGTFALNNSSIASVDEIMTTISNIDHTNLVTEGAVFSFVSASLNGVAGSGLTFNGTNIDLGGGLDQNTTIAANGNNFTIATASNIIFMATNVLTSGSDVGLTASNNVGIEAIADIGIFAIGNVVVSGTEVGITATDIGIIASNNIGLQASGGVDISAPFTQISAGTFALNNSGVNSVFVNEIVTAISIDDDTNLVTEGAVFDFVNSNISKAGSGLTQNGQDIDLGGVLTSNAIITGGFDFDMNVTGSGGISLDAAAPSNFSTSVGNLTFDATLGDVNSTAEGNINTTATNGSINLTAASQNVIINAVSTQVQTGTFGLNNFATVDVDNIVTVFDGLNIENDLATEGAVLDIVSGLAGSGLTFNGSVIDLGGVLTLDANIAGNSRNFFIQDVETFGLQANLQIVIDGGDLNINVGDLNMTSQADIDMTAINNSSVIITATTGSIDLTATANSSFSVTTGNLDFSANSGDVNIDAQEINIIASGAGGDVFIAAQGGGATVIASGDFILFTAFNDIELLANTIDIVSGSFNLPRGASVDEIATVLLAVTSPNDNTLLTAKAIADFVNSNALLPDNGLTNTVGQNIGLGGSLTTATTISMNGNNLIIDDSGTGFFGIDVDDIEIISENDLDLVSANGNIFMQATGNIDLTSINGDVFVQATGVIVEATLADIELIAQTVYVSSGTFALFSGTDVNNIAAQLLSTINDDDNTLLTAKAIADFVNSNALLPDNGLTITTSSGFNGTGLGGTLSTATTITTQVGNDLFIDGGGSFGTFVDIMRFEAENTLDLVSNNANVFVQGTGVIIEATNQNIVLDTDQNVIIEHEGSNNSIETVLSLTRRAGGNSTNNIGEEIAFHIQSGLVSNIVKAASIEVSMIDVTNKHSQVQLSMINTGTLVKALILDGGRNSVAIGANATVNRNDAVILGDFGNNAAFVGIGTDNPQTKLHVVGSISTGTAANMKSHVMMIENISTGSPVDDQNVNGLAINLNVVAPLVTGESNNFITFFTKSAVGLTKAVGAIELTTGSGVSFSANGADYAEWLERKEITENIEAGDIVGIFASQITKNTQDAQQFRVVSTAPIVLGNRPSAENSKKTHEKIAFLGQVPVKVKGFVKAGDYIIPSGKNDGVGIAISAHKVTASQFAQVIGMAWESSDNQNVKKINVAIGLDTPQKAIARLMENAKKQEEFIQELQKQLSNLSHQNMEVKSDNADLKAQVQKIDKMQSQIETLMQMMKSGQQKEVLTGEDDK